jgi:hypothetical protein
VSVAFQQHAGEAITTQSLARHVSTACWIAISVNAKPTLCRWKTSDMNCFRFEDLGFKYIISWRDLRQKSLSRNAEKLENLTAGIYIFLPCR